MGQSFSIWISQYLGVGILQEQLICVDGESESGLPVKQERKFAPYWSLIELGHRGK
jgi:hypothetical protein